MNDENHDVRLRPNPKWVRGMVAGTTVVDSRDSLFVWEIPYYPAWYFPVADVSASLIETGKTTPSSSRGEATIFDLEVGDRIIPSAARRHLDSPVPELRDRVRFEFDALDSWFEEDIEVFVHPRGPDVRIDALRSSRHVRISIDGETIADSHRPTILFETGLPPRYYLPPVDVRMDLLRPTETVTACPYKGWAHYWTASVNGQDHVDLAWGYRTPLPESAAVAGLVCFYNEKVDVEVDGAPEDRPLTPFS